MPAARLTRGLAVAAMLLAMPVLAPPAHAAARVSIDNGSGGAAIDSTYSTTLTISGSGFQAVKGGHGGVYVWFGTVNGKWKPSQGGTSGSNYLYVPDSEAKNNQGFQKYVAFPGSDTAGAANGGTMNGNGGWSTQIVVPGPTFQAVGRNGKVQTVDCRKVRCGIITVGAHGVKNANNETFTPVSVQDLQGSTASQEPSATAAPETPAVSDAPVPGETPEAGAGEADDPAQVVPAAPSLEVDRASAVAGNVLSFTASGLTPGGQYSAVFDDGAAASGPFQAGATGELTGVVQLPADVPAGTHELRLFGNTEGPSVNFAVRAAESGDDAALAARDDDAASRWPVVFAVAAALLLLIAIGRVVFALRRRRSSHAV